MATGTVEAVGHIAPICSHETRDMNAAADLTLRLEASPGDDVTHTRVGFPPHPIYSRKPSQTFLVVCIYGDDKNPIKLTAKVITGNCVGRGSVEFMEEMK